MEYSKIIAVSGLQGLHELVSSKNDGAIVRSLDDKSTRFVSSRIHNFSHLESIEIYTVRDNVNLAEILLAMEKNSQSLPDLKDAAAIKKYFEKVYPDLDFERVYASDMKKIIKWFEVLKNNKIEIILTEPEPEPEEETLVAPVVEKAAAKKIATPAKEEPKKKATQEIKEEPKQKAPAKKKETEAEKHAPKKATKAPTAKVVKSKKEETKEAAPGKKAAPKKK
jgi:hypothetical protein